MKRILILLCSNVVFSQIQVGANINGSYAGDHFGEAVAINSTGNIVAIGAPSNSEVGNESGQVKVISYDGENWSQLGGLLNGLVSSDEVNFGSSLSISSNGLILAVGSPNYDSTANDVGLVQIFKYENSDWVQLGNSIVGTQNNSFMGASISLSSDGNIIAVGTPGESTGGIQRGKVFIYELVSNVWSQLGDPIIGDLNEVFFGNKVKLNSAGNALAVSDFNIDSEPTKIGKVKIFLFNGINWIQKGSSIVGVLSDDNRPKSLDINNDASVIAIGIPGNDFIGQDAGSVKIYTFSNSDWIQKGQDLNGTSMLDFFGFSVSLFNNGNGIIIGSPNFSSNGRMSVFEYIANAWQQSGNNILGSNTGDFFGISLSVSSNNYVAVGAFGNDTNGDNSGQVKIFDINNSLTLEESDSHRVMVYPNPVESNIFFDTGDKMIENIIIYNSGGQKVLEKGCLDNKLLYIEDFSKGVYFLEYTIDGKKYFKNILKK
jgi:hypothetical protein